MLFTPEWLVSREYSLQEAYGRKGTRGASPSHRRPRFSGQVGCEWDPEEGERLTEMEKSRQVFSLSTLLREAPERLQRDGEQGERRGVYWLASEYRRQEDVVAGPSTNAA